MPKSFLAAALGAALLCAGCGGGLFRSDIPVPATYVLLPAEPVEASSGSPTRTVDLVVGVPHVAPGLDTQRIAVLRERRLDYFRDARWGGTTAEIVQALVVATLQDRALFRSVTAEQARIAAHYMLDIEVRDFQAQYDDSNAPGVQVAFLARIVRIADRRLIGTVRVAADRVAQANRMSAVAAAFEEAAQEAALALAERTARIIGRDLQRASPPAVSAETGSTPF